MGICRMTWHRLSPESLRVRSADRGGGFTMFVCFLKRNQMCRFSPGSEVICLIEKIPDYQTTAEQLYTELKMFDQTWIRLQVKAIWYKAHISLWGFWNLCSVQRSLPLGCRCSDWIGAGSEKAAPITQLE